MNSPNNQGINESIHPSIHPFVRFWIFMTTHNTRPSTWRWWCGRIGLDGKVVFHSRACSFEILFCAQVSATLHSRRPRRPDREEPPTSASGPGLVQARIHTHLLRSTHTHARARTHAHTHHAHTQAKQRELKERAKEKELSIAAAQIRRHDNIVIQEREKEVASELKDAEAVVKVARVRLKKQVLSSQQRQLKIRHREEFLDRKLQVDMMKEKLQVGVVPGVGVGCCVRMLVPGC